MKQCTCYALRAIDCTCKPTKYGELYTSPSAKQEQGDPVGTAGELFTNTALERLDFRPSTKIYITPQQRTWVGLTDEDKAMCIQATAKSGLADELIAAIEAKLKEKNG